MTRTKDLTLEALSAADQVANPFFGRRRDADSHQLAGSIQAAQLVVRVIFRRNEGVELWRMGDYSQDIFATLIEKLERKPQRPQR